MVNPVSVSPAAVPISDGFGGGSVPINRPNGAVPSLQGDLAQQVRQLINQGYHIGIEHADLRRYRSNVWQTCTPVSATREGDAMAAISACIAEHPGEYVRIFGIDPKAKRRAAAITVQRPDGSGPTSQPVAPLRLLRPRPRQRPFTTDRPADNPCLLSWFNRLTN
ncbi:MAG: hypothetical protein HC929_14715 [Leptolyngbyaceae cyanobacterium SM2_5_2]|nr:hypothetical protein [Leptolyngbyaceae cyanobacterium SM2_5_2]